MAEEKIERSVAVHDGAFHADEVTACALLIVFDLVDEEKIVRTRDEKLLRRCMFVCDVGGVYDPVRKLFDHHQSDYKGELSSAGMVLLYLKGEGLLSAEEFDYLRGAVIKGVDDHDNGRSVQEMGVCSFSHVIANFAPVSYEVSPEKSREAFQEALHFATGHLQRLRERYRYHLQCRATVKEAMEKYKQCLVFEKAIPWLESFFALGGKEHAALFVIMPAGEHWKLRAIPPDYEHRMQVRLPLPNQWAGLLEEDLKKISEIRGAIFCHKGRFTSVWATKKDAIKALQVVLAKNGVANEDHL